MWVINTFIVNIKCMSETMSLSNTVYHLHVKYEGRLLYLKQMIFTTNPELFLHFFEDVRSLGPLFPIVSFFSYLILIPEKYIWFKNLLFLKGDSNTKHFSFFALYFNVSNKISFTTPAIKFSRIFQPLRLL